MFSGSRLRGHIKSYAHIYRECIYKDAFINVQKFHGFAKAKGFIIFLWECLSQVHETNALWKNNLSIIQDPGFSDNFGYLPIYSNLFRYIPITFFVNSSDKFRYNISENLGKNIEKSWNIGKYSGSWICMNNLGSNIF